MVLPPHTLSDAMLNTVRTATHALAKALKVIGLMNVQFANQGRRIVRAGGQSARLPHRAVCRQGPSAYRSPAGRQGHDGAQAEGPRLHARALPAPLVRQGGRVSPSCASPAPPSRSARKCAPPARSWAWTTTWASPSPRRRRPVNALPLSGNVFLSVKDADKAQAVDLGRQLEALGFTIYSTSGTAREPEEAGVNVQLLAKIDEGRPTVIDLIKNGQLQMIFNTPSGMIPRKDENKDPVGRLRPQHLPQ